MVGLGALPEQFRSEATAISADGSVIVGHWHSHLGGVDTFIWDSTHGLRDLEDMLTAGGADLTGWKDLGAWGISGDGRTIVGIGHHVGGLREAWVARIDDAPIEDTRAVPEPASLVVWCLLSLAVVVPLVRSRSRRTALHRSAAKLR
jgi:hypothetical protein